MAKSKNRYLAGASVKYLYYNATQIPWKQIENDAKVSFSRENRQEIYECTEAYSREYYWLKDGAPVTNTDGLRDEILSCAKGLCEIADHYRPLDGTSARSDVKEVDLNVFSALTIMYSAKSFNLREELHQTAIAAQRLVAGLINEPNYPPMTTSKSSEVGGLIAFITEALNAADSTPARGGVAGSLEYKRWGISVGPRSKEFRQFVGTILKKQFTEDQIRTAFEEARWQAIGQFEDAYDRTTGAGV